MRERMMKKRSLKRRISLLLVVTLVVTSFPAYVFGYADAEDAARPVVATEETKVDSIEAESGIKYDPDYEGTVQIVDELTTKRGEFEKHFVKSDGTAVAISYAQKVHYQVDGVWTDIDSRLELKDKDKGLYGPKSSDLQISLPGTATADILVPASGDSKASIIDISSSYLTKVTDGDYSISWNILGNSKDYTTDFLSKAKTDKLTEAQIPASDLAVDAQPDISKLSHDEQMTALPNLFSTATYKDVIKNVDVAVTVTPDKLKENLIIKSPKDFTSVSYLINAGSLIGKVAEDNSVIFTNDKDEAVFTIPTPLMLDSNTMPEESFDIAVALEKTAQGYILTLTPDNKWMNDPERVYPVILDPTVKTTQSAANIMETYIHSGDTAGEHYTSSYIRIGDTDIAICRGYVDFASRPSINTDLNDIIGGDFVGYLVSGTSTYHSMTIYQPTSSWSASTITWANRPGSGTAIASRQGVDTGTYIKYTFPVDASVKNWYSTGVQNGYMIKYTDETINDYNWFYSSDHPTISTSYYTYLAVEYAPDTTLPVVSSYSLSPSTSSTSYSTNDNPVITWSVTEKHLKEVQYSINGGSYTKMGTTTSGSYTIPDDKITISGVKTIRIRALDYAGNSSIDSEVSTKSYYFDITDPIVSSFSLSPSTSSSAYAANDNPVLSWSITENSLSEVQYAIGSGSYTKISTSKTGTYTIPDGIITASGTYAIKLRALDSAGNYSAPLTQNYYFDITAPTKTAIPPNGELQVTFTPSGSDIIVDVWMSDTPSGLLNYKVGSTGSLTSIPSNPYKITYTVPSADPIRTLYVYDKAGNVFSESIRPVDVNDYSPTNVTLGNYYGKNLITWDAPETMADCISYRVYKASAPFSSSSNAVLIADDLEVPYFMDTDIGQSGTFYYNVQAVEKDVNRNVLHTTAQASQVYGAEKALSEFAAGIGSQSYMDYFTFDTPVGNGTIEKSSGNLSYSQSDFALSNLGFEYGLSRTYNSNLGNDGMLGTGWLDSWHKEIYTGADGTIYFRTGDGTTYTFALNESSEYVCFQTKDFELTLAESVEDEIQYVIDTKDNVTYEFNRFGQMINEREPNGSSVGFAYDNLGRLDKVISNATPAYLAENPGEDIKYLSMNYSASNPYLLDTITLPDDSVMEYVYTAGGQLETVTHRENAFSSLYISFDYGYSTSGKLNSLEDGVGNGYAISYNLENKANMVTYPNSDVFSLDYSVDANEDYVTTVTKSNGAATIFGESATLDGDTGKPLESVSALGLTTQYIYDLGAADSSDNPFLVEQTISEVFYESLNETLSGFRVGFASQPVIVTMTNTYNANDNVVQEETVTGSVTETTSYAYEGAGKYNEDQPTQVTTAVTGAQADITTYTYDSLGNLMLEVENNGTASTDDDTLTGYLRDTSESILDIDEVVYLAESATAYIGKTDAEKVEDADNVSNVQYDEEGQLLSSESILGEVETDAAATYDSMGRVLTETSVTTGAVTSYTYDFLGRAITVTTTLGTETDTVINSYNGNGSLTSTTSADGITTSYTFDSLNRELSRTVTGASQETGELATTAYGYEAITLPSEVGGESFSAYKESYTLNGQLAWQKWYDGEGQIVKEVNAGVTSYYMYDGSGNQVLSWMSGDLEDPSRASMSLYDAQGNNFANISNPVIGEEGGETTYSVGASSILTQTKYYSDGQVKASIDGEGIITYYVYDDQNRIISVTEDATLDGQDNLTGGITTAVSYPDEFTREITNAIGTVMSQTVNEAGLTTRTQTGEGTGSIATDFAYDVQGNLIRETYGDGTWKEYEYNNRNLVSETKTYAAGADLEIDLPLTQVTYVYNSDDRVIEEVDLALANSESGLEEYHYIYYGYDGLGRLVSVSELTQEALPTQTEIDDHQLTYSYNSKGQVTEVQYPMSTSDEVKGLLYLYDSYGRMDEIQADLGTGTNILRQYSYNCFGEVSDITDYADFTGSGDEDINRAYVYDSFGRVTSMVYVEGISTVIESFEMTYDSNSNILTEEDGDILKSYVYDDLGRLATTSTTKDQVTETTSYSYDNAGNRLTKEKGDLKEEYTYNNSLNQLTDMTESELDENEVYQEVASTDYSYDLKGNMTEEKETRASAVKIVSNAYTVDNMLSGTTITQDSQTVLVQENLYNGAGQRVSKDENGIVTNYYYQDGSVSYTSDTAGAKTSQNLLNINGSAIATARYSPTDISYYLYNKDIRNSTASIVDETAGFATKYSYDEFGITTEDNGYSFTNEICYTGGIYDWKSGQYYLNARYYDPQIGRFLSEDTYRGEMNEPNSWHLYAYCANNPINYVDPSGHDAIVLSSNFLGFAGHMAVLIQTATNWKYLSWDGDALESTWNGRNANTLKYTSVKSARVYEDVNKRFERYIKGRHRYHSYLYIKGNFSGSLSFISQITSGSAKALDTGIRINRYDLGGLNCAWVALEVLRHGNLSLQTSNSIKNMQYYKYRRGYYSGLKIQTVLPNEVFSSLKNIFNVASKSIGTSMYQ